MSKLVLSFKGQAIEAFHITEDTATIGRDPGCDFVIDSLAIALTHAQIIISPDNTRLVSLDDEYPLEVNQEIVTDIDLKHGDIISIGKHTLTYSSDAQDFSLPPEIDEEASKLDPQPLAGYVQILNGSHLGRVIPLNKALTRLGQSGANCAVIAHRGYGFYLSHLEGQTTPVIEGSSIGEHSYELNSGDIIEIGETRMQFYAESA